MSKMGETVTISINDTDTVGDGLYEDIIEAFRYQILRDHGIELHESKFVLGDITITAEIIIEEELDNA
jgi:hypothetical protein